jgi:hypothetical protein
MTMPPAHELEEKFNSLIKRWKSETQHHSIPNEFFNHPAYQEMVDLGTEVLPLIFKEMQINNITFLELAAEKLTGIETPEEVMGIIEDGFRKFKPGDIRDWWIQWAKDNGHLD